MTHQPTVAIVGMATVDYIYNLPSHPKEDSENRALEHSVSVGGPAGRSAIAAARLGGAVRVLATCGTGVHAETLQTQLTSEGIACEWVESEQDSQHSAILVAADNATRTTVWLPQPRADDRLFGRLPTVLDGADIVLLDCTDEALTRRVVKSAQLAGVPTVVDTGSWKPWAPSILPEVDHVIAPSKFFSKRSKQSLPEQLRDWLEHSKSEVVVATEGGEGGQYAVRERPDLVDRYPAAEVVAVDTCGAGDTFHGAYAFAIGAGLSVPDSLTVASWSAGLKTTAVGNGMIPTWDQVAQQLGEEA
ncbi:PfkB family carbohydrate kinase [Gordonia sp. NPDC062954]|uniref:PfkB family carbohydrate kinase n=1 Tax=Gordonia sp. NPDC062954 TaxID=3364003 RepID=UPI0037CBA122